MKTKYCCEIPPRREDLKCNDCGECNRYEKVAIMTCEGVTEDEAECYCDNLPFTFGTRR